MPEKTSDIWWLFSRQTVSITPRESVLKSALLMTGRNFRHLPVLNEAGRITGIISAQDIIDSLNLTLDSSSSQDQVKASLEMPVERIMSGRPIAVEPGDGLAEVVKKFCYHNLGALPVVDELGVVVGIITLRDVVDLMAISSTPMEVRVAEIMNTSVVTIRPDSPISSAVRLMSENRVRRLPVVSEDDTVLGVLTNKDILRRVAELASGEGARSNFRVPVSSSVRRDAITVGSEEDVRVAASRMMIFGVGGLVIGDLPGRKIALVTERDLVRTLVARRSVDFLVQELQYEFEAGGGTPQLSR